MAKLTKEDWKTFWQILFVVTAIVVPLGFVIMGVDNAVLKGSLSNQVDAAIQYCDTVVSDLATTTDVQIQSLQKTADKCVKNINFLIHRTQILEEKVAKLEAQLEAHKCEHEKK